MKIEELMNLIEKYKSSKLYSALKLFEEKSSLAELKAEIKEYKPKIAVMGEFSSGKSTLINSFLGMDILPAKFQPTTVYITEIKYSKDNYIIADGNRYELTKDNLEKFTEVKNNKIEVFINNPILQDYIFIDTPGTNDPAKFTDDIVFNLIGECDVVIFVMNINQALKETERQFISKLIRKKDLGKFFFVLNFADMVSNARIIKNEIIDKLNSLLDLDREILKKHIFPFSAKQVLESRLKNEENSSYEIFTETIREYIKSYRDELLNLWIDQKTAEIVNSILVKIETFEDQLTGKTKQYEKELEKVNQQIKEFELAISKELLTFEKDLNEIKKSFKNRIKNSIKLIYDEIKNEVNSMTLEQLKGTRYVELRTKKLLEDSIEIETKVFLKDLEKIVKDFDKKIVELNDIKFNLSVPIVKKTDTGRKLVNLGALVAGGATVYSSLPGITLIAGLGSSAGALLSTIPVVGTIATATLPVIGAFALTAGKILFDVAKWGVGKLGDVASHLEEKAKKKSYLMDIKNSLDKIEKQVLPQIDKINIEEFKTSYLESKFPQKKLLEEKIKLLQERQFQEEKLLNEDLELLEKFKNELLLIHPQLSLSGGYKNA